MLAAITVYVEVSGPSIDGEDEAAWEGLHKDMEVKIGALTFTDGGREYVVMSVDSELDDVSED